MSKKSKRLARLAYAKCKLKKKFKTEQEAVAYAPIVFQKYGTVMRGAYHCLSCSNWHLTKKKINTKSGYRVAILELVN